jgi:hypothetical protein
VSDKSPIDGAGPSDLSIVVINLMKGPVYRDTHEKPWALLVGMRSQVGDYVSVLGLQVVVDESEGYAYLRSRPVEGESEEFPRLIARRALSFHVSVLLALLRKRLAEFDASSSDPRLVLTREQMVEMLRLYLPETPNEVRLVENIDTYLNQAVAMGFLRRLRGQDDHFEVRRIIKAYVDGQWLSDFDARLDEYLWDLRHAGSDR